MAVRCAWECHSPDQQEHSHLIVMLVVWQCCCLQPCQKHAVQAWRLDEAGEKSVSEPVGALNPWLLLAAACGFSTGAPFNESETSCMLATGRQMLEMGLEASP